MAVRASKGSRIIELSIRAYISSIRTNAPLRPSPGTQPFPFSNIPTYCEQLLSGYWDLSPLEAPFSGNEIGIVFDTGVPSTGIHTDADNEL
ncbi:MAG TPA: hypothetical protein VIF37_00855 [Methylobacter sp.]|jgi:hypothetical protein